MATTFPPRRRQLGAIAAPDETESLAAIMQRVGTKLFPDMEVTPTPPADPVPEACEPASVALVPRGTPRPAVPAAVPPAHAGGLQRLGAVLADLVASPRNLLSTQCTKARRDDAASCTRRRREERIWGRPCSHHTPAR